MSENDNELRQALAENGSFDAGKAAAAKQKIVANFGAKLRAVERSVWIYLAICVCVAISAYRAFEHSSSTKSQILFAVVFLVAFESTILIKLWYWVANTKISLLKEIKLLRLAQPSRPEQGEGQVGESLRLPLARWERVVWLVVLVLCAAVVPNVLVTVGAYKAELLCEAYVTLEPDGSGTELVKMEFQNVSTMPMTTFPFNAPAAWDIRWLDEQGRPMTATSTTEKDRKQYTVELPKPLMPGEWCDFTRIAKGPAMAERQNDGSWVYRFDEDYGCPKSDFKVGIRLPEGMAGPATVSGEGSYEHFSLIGRDAFATGRRDSNKHFKLDVKYRMTDAKQKAEQAGP